MGKTNERVRDKKDRDETSLRKQRGGGGGGWRLKSRAEETREHQ